MNCSQENVEKIDQASAQQTYDDRIIGFADSNQSHEPLNKTTFVAAWLNDSVCTLYMCEY